MTYCNTPNNNRAIRNLYFECQTTILNNFNIPNNKRLVVSGFNCLVLPVEAGNYTRIEEGNKTSFRDTFKQPFITPSLIRVGFTVRVDDNSLSSRRCLEFLATSSASTSYNNTYIPVKVFDYVRPEVNDSLVTIRQGILTLSGGNGFSGSDNSGSPIYTEPYDINFLEIQKRLIC